MKTFLVVTITCPDQPGIVERITQTVLAHSANWEDSRLARLGGDFAGIVLVSADAQHVDALTQSLLDLSGDQTTVTVKRTRESQTPPVANSRLFDLTLTGADHEGIVHKVSAYLATQSVNVESMDTSVTPAPMSASPLFHMQAVIKVPAHVAHNELISQLQLIGDELAVGIEVKPHAD